MVQIFLFRSPAMVRSSSFLVPDGVIISNTRLLQRTLSEDVGNCAQLQASIPEQPSDVNAEIEKELSKEEAVVLNKDLKQRVEQNFSNSLGICKLNGEASLPSGSSSSEHVQPDVIAQTTRAENQDGGVQPVGAIEAEAAHHSPNLVINSEIAKRLKQRLLAEMLIPDAAPSAIQGDNNLIVFQPVEDSSYKVPRMEKPNQIQKVSKKLGDAKLREKTLKKKSLVVKEKGIRKEIKSHLYVYDWDAETSDGEEEEIDLFSYHPTEPITKRQLKDRTVCKKANKKAKAKQQEKEERKKKKEEKTRIGKKRKKKSERRKKKGEKVKKKGQREKHSSGEVKLWECG